jgi:hypothetical protein
MGELYQEVNLVGWLSVHNENQINQINQPTRLTTQPIRGRIIGIQVLTKEVHYV